MRKKIKVIILIALLCLTYVNIVRVDLKSEETDTYSPEILSINADPDTVGYGFNITIAPSVTDNLSGVNLVKVNVTFPDETYGNFTMNYTGNNTYEYVLSDTWQRGQYNYTIWAIDNASNANISSQHSFNVSAQATISVCTVKDEYDNNETVNLTDPSGDPPLIGYEFLDDGEVLRIWNKYDSYYFNTSSGIQITNHYNEYWSHNVLMLGYYNGGNWHLLYRTDELSGFNKNLESDNKSYVNATLWKDLTYQGYNFRLAIRYHLGLNDNDLTVIPFIKNLGQAIPYTLGFGWEIKDIKIADTYENDWIRLYNGTDWNYYRLNQTLDKKYTSMDHNTTFYLEGKNEGKYFRRTLYLSWNHTLDYLLWVKSRDDQYNAPVTLFIKIGTLSAGLEKYTSIHWFDSDEWLGVGSSEHDSCCGNCAGEGATLENALDGTLLWQHDASETHWFILDLGQTFTVKKVRGRSLTSADPTSVNVYVSDSKTSWGTAVATGISAWCDIPIWQEVDTTDKNGRYIKVEITATEDTRCSYIQFGGYDPPFTIIDVYGDIVNQTPVISDPFPTNGSTGVSTAPLLNITVSDLNGYNMNITWLSNSSGSWVAFGSNCSVGNGTYHQTMSNVSVNGQWWYWRVNVSDGMNYSESSIYKFYTGHESKIMNTGITNFSGYLLIQLQYYKESLEEWVVDFDIVNETTPRVINSGEYLSLDSIVNGLVNSRNLSYGNATYRVYVALRNKYGNVLESYDGMDVDQMNGTFEFKFLGPWRQLIKDGFGSDANIATRSMEIYDDELYVGTQNVNFYGLIDLFWDLFEDLSESEISELDSAEEYNDFMTAFLDDHNLDIEVNMSEDEFNETNSTVIQIIRENKNDINSTETAAEFDDLMISMFENESLNYGVETYFYECELFGIGKWFNPLTLFGNILSELVCFFSDGCEVWKYSDNTKIWTQIVGDNAEAMKKAGFGKKTNCCASTMKVFNDSLYVGTWNSMIKGSCEVWRYDGTDWEKVVGNDSIGESGGFGYINNVAVWSMEVFDGYLYGGTLNTDFSGNGCCQIWRTQDGEEWEKVVDKGFRPDGADVKHKNVYAWRMEEFQSELYVGTFNAQLVYPNYRGCQLWCSSSGNYGTWSKVPLPVDAEQSDFKDGFGEPDNYGIRVLVDYNDELYVGTAASVIQEDEALEIWKYDGSDWYPIIGDDVPGVDPGEKEYDGFGDLLNKYAWSDTIAGGKLWVGTGNGQLHLNGVETEGCEVWCYDGTIWKPIVRDDDGEKDNGFGLKENEGARDMIEYPEGSGNIFVGTFKAVVEGFIEPDGNQRGCEVWWRKATEI